MLLARTRLSNLSVTKAEKIQTYSEVFRRVQKCSEVFKGIQMSFCNRPLSGTCAAPSGTVMQSRHSPWLWQRAAVMRQGLLDVFGLNYVCAITQVEFYQYTVTDLAVRGGAR